jgi:CubicO group peptidase (beta-lactamase class C family)
MWVRGGRLLAVCFLAAPASTADEVDELARVQMDRSHIPAMAVVVVRDGAVQKLTGYGTAHLDWDAPASPGTAFQMASGTKPFTGVLLMTLVEQGRLDLDAPVRRYLPDAPDTWNNVTIRHLATHTSGLKRDFGPGQSFATVEEAVAAAYGLPFDYETGTQSQYALTDFVVLTRILEKVSGRGFVDLLREQVARPLGMEDTGFDDAVEDGPVRSWLPLKGRATTYRWNGAAQRAYVFDYPRFTYSAGGLFSSAADVGRLFVALARGTLLKPASLERMWTPATLADGRKGEFGVGWVVGRYRGLRAIGHSGGPALSDLLYFPDRKLGIAVLTNQGALFPVLAELVADLYLPADARPEDREIPDPDPDLTSRLRSLVVAIGQGTVREEDFSPEGRKGVLPALREFGGPLMRQVGPLTSFRLIGRQARGDRTEHVYRAYFGRHPMKWRFVLDTDGRISDLEPSSRD